MADEAMALEGANDEAEAEDAAAGIGKLRLPHLSKSCGLNQIAATWRFALRHQDTQKFGKVIDGGIHAPGGRHAELEGWCLEGEPVVGPHFSFGEIRDDFGIGFERAVLHTHGIEN